MKIPVLHLTDDLRVGGVAHVMQGLCHLADTRYFEPMILGLSGFESFAKSLNKRGVRSYIVGKGLEGLGEIIPRGKAFAAVIHRSGESSPLWSHALKTLKKHGAKAILERSVFGYPDKTDAGKISDHIFCNSKDTLLKHWHMMGEPDIADYLKKYRTIYNPVDYGQEPASMVLLRKKFREKQNIPADAFVLGDIARPDFRIDYMLPAIFPRLLAEIPNLYVLTRRFPDVLAKPMAAIGGDRYMNLKLTHDADELLETYAGMDVLTHFCSMGESFGMAIAEAMCCGKPVIVNRTPQQKLRNAQVELVEDQVNGLVVENVFEAYQAIKKLAEDKSYYQGLSEKAKVRFNDAPFSKACVISQWEDAIDQVFARKGIDLGREKSDTVVQPSLASLTHMLSKGSLYHPKALASYPLSEWRWMIQAKTKCFHWQVKRKLMRWAS